MFTLKRKAAAEAPLSAIGTEEEKGASQHRKCVTYKMMQCSTKSTYVKDKR
jgi:fatty acid/phospholipid biosynthesis enzyme